MLSKGRHYPLNGCGYGHVTVLKFCHLPWCSALCGFVIDSWSTFYFRGFYDCANFG